MKKTLIATALLAGAVSGYSQGQIYFQDYGATGFQIVLYGQQTLANSPVQVTYNGYTVFEQQGNVSHATDANELNPGTTTYPAANLLTGTSYDVQILAASGSGDALSSLVPVGGTVNFYPSGGFAGLFLAAASPVTLGTQQTAESVALAAWANTGVDGAATTLAAAQADGYAWGVSTVGSIASLGGDTLPPGYLPASLTSFSLGVTSTTPEPSTIALGVIGASAFLMRLRRKQ